jgi:hypothetical protein
MLRELTEFILPSRRPPRECEACGQSFVCGASLTGCWCFGYKLSADTRQQLRARYQNCLCRDCLTGFADGKGSDSSEVS